MNDRYDIDSDGVLIKSKNGLYTLYSECIDLEDKIEVAEKLYHELLWAVCARTPGETRHETALRYIKEKESGGSNTLSTLREKE